MEVQLSAHVVNYVLEERRIAWQFDVGYFVQHLIEIEERLSCFVDVFVGHIVLLSDAQSRVTLDYREVQNPEGIVALLFVCAPCQELAQHLIPNDGISVQVISFSCKGIHVRLVQSVFIHVKPQKFNSQLDA